MPRAEPVQWFEAPTYVTENFRDVQYGTTTMTLGQDLRSIWDKYHWCGELREVSPGHKALGIGGLREHGN